jgi:hypothetical protein
MQFYNHLKAKLVYFQNVKNYKRNSNTNCVIMQYRSSDYSIGSHHVLLLFKYEKMYFKKQGVSQQFCR